MTLGCNEEQRRDSLAHRAVRLGLDFTSGATGGFAGKLVEYPFDTVKVLLQTSSDRHQSVGQCIRRVYARHGIRGFYQGMASPLMASMAEKSVLFTAFDATHTYILPETMASQHKVLVAGAAGGFAVSFLLTPFELVKCKLQARDTYSGPLHCAREVIKREGLVTGLFRGHVGTMLREIPGNMAWFGVYRGVCESMAPPGGSHQDVKGWQTALAGGCAGMAFWTANFPADTVKSRQQADLDARHLSFTQTLRGIYRSGGVRALYKGWLITAARALPSNAVIFWTYELVSKELRMVQRSMGVEAEV